MTALTPLNLFPEETLVTIFSFLTADTLWLTKRVCKVFQDIIEKKCWTSRPQSLTRYLKEITNEQVAIQACFYYCRATESLFSEFKKTKFGSPFQLMQEAQNWNKKQSAQIKQCRSQYSQAIMLPPITHVDDREWYQEQFRQMSQFASKSYILLSKQNPIDIIQTYRACCDAGYLRYTPEQISSFSSNQQVFKILGAYYYDNILAPTALDALSCFQFYNLYDALLQSFQSNSFTLHPVAYDLITRLTDISFQVLINNLSSYFLDAAIKKWTQKNSFFIPSFLFKTAQQVESGIKIINNYLLEARHQKKAGAMVCYLQYKQQEDVLEEKYEKELEIKFNNLKINFNSQPGDMHQRQINYFSTIIAQIPLASEESSKEEDSEDSQESSDDSLNQYLVSAISLVHQLNISLNHHCYIPLFVSLIENKKLLDFHWDTAEMVCSFLFSAIEAPSADAALFLLYGWLRNIEHSFLLEKGRIDIRPSFLTLIRRMEENAFRSFLEQISPSFVIATLFYKTSSFEYTMLKSTNILFKATHLDQMAEKWAELLKFTFRSQRHRSTPERL